MEDEPTMPKGLGKEKSRQNIANRARTIDDYNGGESTIVG